MRASVSSVWGDEGRFREAMRRVRAWCFTRARTRRRRNGALDDSADPDAFVSAPHSARLLRELNGGDVSAK